MKTHLKIFTTILSVLACCAFLPTMQAQLPPEIPGNPDGCYPAFTTAEGCNALHQLFGGLGNTGVGWYSLFLAGDGSFNTGVGAGTLALTSRTGVGTDANSNTAVGTAAMILNLSGSQNTAVGTNALVNNMIAIGNNGVGSFVLYNNDSSGAGSANGNNAFGHAALFSNIDGAGNCAFGDDALFSSVITSDNTAIGDLALFSNDFFGTGNAVHNTAVGSGALAQNTESRNNTAVGAEALVHNDVTGNGFAANNTAVGWEALEENIDADRNTAVGSFALQNNDSTGNGAATGNTAVGSSALVSNTDGESNVAIGDDSLSNNVSGFHNTVVGGGGAGFNIINGFYNVYIGWGVSANGPFDESNTIRIRDSAPAVGGTTSQVFFAGIDGSTVGALNSPVLINPNGQLGTGVSSARFKKDIDPMGTTSEAIFSLKPVTFHYKGDTTNTAQFGLIAEEVAKVNPALILTDKEGKPYSVRYEHINAMLLNEFLKEHRTVQDLKVTAEKQQATITELKNEFRTISTQQRQEIQLLSAQLKSQAAQIQKVSARLELNEPCSRTVLNNEQSDR